MTRRPRIAVISPFLDKRHGTERVVAEQVERLVHDYGWEIHLYSQRIEGLADVRLSGEAPSLSAANRSENGNVVSELQTGSLIWHRVPNIPGPHLLQYTWWLFANHLWRWRDARFRNLRYDLIYSPGINCLDADAIAVHMVFHEFHRLVGKESKLNKLSLRAWHRMVHRRIYYALIMALEKRIYRDRRVRLSAVSRLVAGQLARFFGRNDVSVISNAVDAEQFNPGEREARRASARIELGIGKNDFVLLLIGNDWKKKGLTCLLRSLTQLDITRVRLLVVGTDVVSPYESILQKNHLHEKVFFFPPRADVQYYYAAADAYVGPSLEDAFALPPAEAMACGLPVIVSSEAGVSEWVMQNSNGLILENPHDAEELKRLICSLVADASFCKRLGENGAITARQYSWERNVVAAKSFLEEAIRRKVGTAAQSDAQESDEI